LVQVRIVELKGLGKYSITFKRIQGDPLGFRNIWAQIETLLLTWRSTDGYHLLFQDDYMDEGSCIDELQTKKGVGRKIKSVIV